MGGKEGRREERAQGREGREIHRYQALEIDTVCSKFMQCRHNNSCFGSYLPLPTVKEDVCPQYLCLSSQHIQFGLHSTRSIAEVHSGILCRLIHTEQGERNSSLRQRPCTYS